MAGKLPAIRAVQGDCQWPLKNVGNYHQSCEFTVHCAWGNPKSIIRPTNHERKMPATRCQPVSGHVHTDPTDYCYQARTVKQFRWSKLSQFWTNMFSASDEMLMIMNTLSQLLVLCVGNPTHHRLTNGQWNRIFPFMLVPTNFCMNSRGVVLWDVMTLRWHHCNVFFVFARHYKIQ